MERRAFLRGLLLAPIAVPVAMKAGEGAPPKSAFKIEARRFGVEKRLNVRGVEVKNVTQTEWAALVDTHGHVVGVKLNNVSA